jgi:hypothetical protein
MPASYFVRRDAHGVGVEITAYYLWVFKRRLARNLQEDVVRKAGDEFSGCRRGHAGG